MQLRRLRVPAKQLVGDKRGVRQAVHIPAGEQIEHSGIADQNHCVHPIGIHPCRRLHPAQQGVYPVPDAPGQGFPVTGQGLLDAGNDIRAVHPLGVWGDGLSQQGPIRGIEPGRQSGGADVYGGTVFFKNGVGVKRRHMAFAADGLHRFVGGQVHHAVPLHHGKARQPDALLQRRFLQQRPLLFAGGGDLPPYRHPALAAASVAAAGSFQGTAVQSAEQERPGRYLPHTLFSAGLVNRNLGHIVPPYCKRAKNPRIVRGFCPHICFMILLDPISPAQPQAISRA